MPFCYIPNQLLRGFLSFFSCGGLLLVCFFLFYRFAALGIYVIWCNYFVNFWLSLLRFFVAIFIGSCYVFFWRCNSHMMFIIEIYVRISLCVIRYLAGV